MNFKYNIVNIPGSGELRITSCEVIEAGTSYELRVSYELRITNYELLAKKNGGQRNGNSLLFRGVRWERKNGADATLGDGMRRAGNHDTGQARDGNRCP
jgi:hypothetical protein